MAERKFKENTSKTDSALCLSKVAACFETSILDYKPLEPEILEARMKTIFEVQDLTLEQRTQWGGYYDNFIRHKDEILAYEAQLSIKTKSIIRNVLDSSSKVQFLKDVGFGEESMSAFDDDISVSRHPYYFVVNLWNADMDKIKNLWLSTGKGSPPNVNFSGWVTHKNPKMNPLLENKVVWVAERNDLKVGSFMIDLSLREKIRVQAALERHEVAHIFNLIYFPEFMSRPSQGEDSWLNFLDFHVRSELSASILNSSLQEEYVVGAITGFYGVDKVKLLGDDFEENLSEICEELRSFREDPENLDIDGMLVKKGDVLSKIVLFSKDRRSIVKNLKHFKLTQP